MSQSQVLYFCFFTRGTPYEDEAKIIKRSFEGIGLRHEIIGIPNRGTWQKNTQAKAEVVQQFCEKYPNQRLVYLDVDAVVLAKPVLFETTTADVAAVLYSTNRELLAGTIYLFSNERTMAVVRRWRELNEMYPDTLPNGEAAWDQKTLQMAIKEHKKEGLQFEALPQEYCYMIGNSQRQYPGLTPIILHYSAAFRWGTGETRTWDATPAWK